MRPGRFEIVVVGASSGGLHALEALLSALPASFPLPVVVAQHRRADSKDELGVTLGRHSILPIRDAEDKEPILPSNVYLAPSDYHLLVEVGHLALSTEGLVSHARPSIDALFESAADAYGRRTIGVVLTGANDDGAQGSARIKQRGGLVVIQDPATAQSATMPKAAITATQADHILHLEEIGGFLSGLVAPGTRSEG